MDMQDSLNNFIVQIITTANSVVESFVQEAFVNIVSGNMTAFTSMMVVFVIFTGIRGMLQGYTMSDIVTPIAKLTVVFVLATNWDYFHKYIYSFFMRFPDEIIMAMGGGSGSDGYGLNKVFARGFDVAVQLFSQGGISSIQYYILGFIVVVINLGVMAVGLGGIIIAKLLCGIYMFLGPVFIMLALFESTRPILENWLQQLVTVTLWPILICGVLLMIVKISDVVLVGSSTDMNAAGAISTAFEFISFQTLSAFLLSQVPSKAAALAGGVALSGYKAAIQSVRDFKSNSSSMRDSIKAHGHKAWGHISKGAAIGGVIAKKAANANTNSARNLSNRLFNQG